MNSYLIVGLGNIGAEYAQTRHNIGFDVADAFVKQHDGGWHIDRLAEVSQFKIKGRAITVIKPTTYMNLSGKAMKFWLDKEKIALEHSLTIVDELALPLEKIRLRPSGSDAGHNGLKSIQDYTGTNEFPKLRFGIGNNFPKGRQVDFVLGKWKPDEQPLVAQKIDTCVSVITSFILEGIQPAMNRYNNLTFK
ncbi:MAG: aminoacyl-tRNA hydrolase [Bacteroidetes bacterium]|uniref:aminoacyl-tRNA hydrolase n=1 Tax=Phnomibacter sp. TaxID=2836217 RepID=UPI002FDD6B05|nr:aminoacyl-tRNA hydrolase [Bacteroidota bacterium]